MISKVHDLEKVIDFINKNIANDIRLEDLSEVAGLSRFALTRLFHKHKKGSPMRFLWETRARICQDKILKSENTPLWTIAREVGFNSPQHFSRKYKQVFGYCAKIERRVTIC